MAQIKAKGTVLEKVVGNSYTAIAQIISLELPESKSESYEADTLDNNAAGIPKKVTGRADGGSLSADVFLDLALSSHKLITALIVTPASANWRLTFADGANTNMTFASAAIGLGGSVALKEAVKGKLTIELDGIPTFPT